MLGCSRLFTGRFPKTTASWGVLVKKALEPDITFQRSKFTKNTQLFVRFLAWPPHAFVRLDSSHKTFTRMHGRRSFGIRLTGLVFDGVVLDPALCYGYGLW